VSESFDIRAPHVYSAIADVTAKLSKSGISKGRKNQSQGYNFRGIDDLYNAVSSVISDARLCILPRVLSRVVTERETQKGGVLFYVVLEVEFDFVSAEDGSRHEPPVRVIGEAMDSGDKATNKAMSAAYKYACMQVFCIPTEGGSVDSEKDSPKDIKPQAKGWGVHSPKGDIDPAVVDTATAYADRFKDALANGAPEIVVQTHADMALETDPDGERWDEVLKIAVWDQLNSKARSAIKTILAGTKA